MEKSLLMIFLPVIHTGSGSLRSSDPEGPELLSLSLYNLTVLLENTFRLLMFYKLF